jgi:hypothetical protein
MKRTEREIEEKDYSTNTIIRRKDTEQNFRSKRGKQGGHEGICSLGYVAEGE